jgi:DNA mismatch repair protein MSH4
MLTETAQIMSERAGVINMHLAVDTSDDNTMTMLYKIDEGFVQEEHYGLALARVVDLPPQVLEIAEEVSQALEAQAAAKKKSSKAFALAKRRKLVLSLRETLKQAESSPMEGKVLLGWLRKLQEEFVHRMEQIENDVASSETEGTVADEEEDGPQVEGRSEAQTTDLQV